MVTADECAIPAGAKAGCTVPNKTVISASRDCPIDADVDRRYGMSNAGQDGRASVERRFLRTNINFESVDLTFSADETDHRHRCLLRPRRERPRGRRTAEQGGELATPHLRGHSITSSARASSVGGTSRPSALAVLRLTTSSYFVGACTGRSAGLSPLRMRST